MTTESAEVRAKIAKMAGELLAESVGWDRETRTAKVPQVAITRESMQQMGLHLWHWSFAHVDEDDMEGAVRGLIQNAPPTAAFYFATEVGQTSAVASARWAHYGFPVVQYSGHKYAAALMATKISEGDIQPPWKTFLIELPNGLLQTRGGPDNSYREIAYCLVSYHPILLVDRSWGKGWTFDCYTRDGVNLHIHRQTIEDLRGRRVSRGFDEDGIDPFAYEMDSEDDRTLELITRLVLNTCVAMSNPDVVRPIGKHPKDDTKRGPSLRNGKEPVSRVYRVGKDITLDCREALRAYVRGERRGPLTVQFLVRGHWRQQACGPQRMDRRATWIEPYWKGPEDAPIPVRGMKVGTE